MAALALQNVYKKYGSVEAITDVSLEVREGEFVVFVGPSGCGKSTLLRMIAGLEDISSGRLMIGAEERTHTDPAKRQIAMVFQSYALYPHLTVRGNLGFALRMAGESKPAIAAKVDPIATMLQLSGLMDRRPSQLSGGQRQRVAIGRALVRSPKVFLFDEPLSNLDAELRVQMRVELAQLHKKIGVTTIYVTHDQVEAMTLADRIVVVRNGRIEQIGAPIELYDNPSNLFVAGFIGSPRINEITATVTGVDESDLLLELPGGARISYPRLELTAVIGDRLTLGVRPEHFIRITGDPQNGVRVNVDYWEHLGGVSYAYGALANGQRIIFEERLFRSPVGDRSLSLEIDISKAFLFDATGRRRR
ncbi:sn-glycerol-3-phosphate ABC transporter ATP-binding protein UgpC [Mesorhizobium sp.]|uniref:ABC transporter ATP-binding protein n=1 Tax=Mesorhizobium sp. TaxID=1871066 RepID=UPI0012048E38|nr:sn-glycerol-3-phosphate ABC transporter ATP-binding protein UgpC [Mesorhizobium sp.]TIP18366.1 MAG: sn-glycerol-3-phosphate ABC transporter ATP-binding protein UgpC [Mesorhizobium sp.]